jgi:hypothetical protein
MPAKKKSAKKEPGTNGTAYEVPEEMKQWCALLTQELSSWGQVDVRKMFGMTSFYRRGAIFAAVPATKAFFSPYSIIFKLQTPTIRQQKLLVGDSRINQKFGIGQKWYGFELASSADIHGALEWLDEAFRAASTPAKPARKRPV